MTLKVLEFPSKPTAINIAEALRKLADCVEAGDYDECRNLAWVIDCSDSRVELGYLGQAGEPAAAAHFLFALANRRLELGALDVI